MRKKNNKRKYEESEIRYSNLSKPLKGAVILSYAVGILYFLFFMLGVFIQLVG